MSEPKPSAVPQDRRVFQRLSLEAEVGFASDSNFYTGFTEDISEGGLFMATYDMRPIGTEIDINFTLPNGHEVKAQGVVRWLREPRDAGDDTSPGMGIQFVKLDPKDHKTICEFVAARAPLFYDDDL